LRHSHGSITLIQPGGQNAFVHSLRIFRTACAISCKTQSKIVGIRQKKSGRPTPHLGDFYHPAAPKARIAAKKQPATSQPPALLHTQSFLAPRAFFCFPAHGVVGAAAAAAGAAQVDAGVCAGFAAEQHAAGAGVTGVWFDESIAFSI
jgi:hypothetical protein